MNMHINRPDLAADSLPPKLAAQHRRAEKTRQRVRKLREKAFEEIERLIAFLDASDGYTMDEREVNGDEADASFVEGWRFAEAPMEDDEDDASREPWLGSPEYHPSGYETMGGPATQERWAQGANDGREDVCEDEGAQCEDEGSDWDGEPSLGWTVDGVMGAATSQIFDGELADGLMTRPTKPVSDPGVRVECSYRKFIHGLTDDQKEAVRERMLPDSGVSLR